MIPKIASFEDFLNIYNAYRLYMAGQKQQPEQKPEQQPEKKPEQKPEKKPEETTPAWAQSLLDRMDKLEKRQPGVSVENVHPVGLEDVIKKML